MAKTWFITGASAGLGVEIALYALDKGDNVVVTARAAKTSENTPLQLAGGHDAVDAIRDHSTALLEELSLWEKVAQPVAFDGADQSAA